MAINFDRLDGQSCGKCTHFFADDDEKQGGQCRYGPPPIVAISQPVAAKQLNKVTMQIEIIQTLKVELKTVPRSVAANDPGCHCYEVISDAEEKGEQENS